ncbi:MAG: hypothetical protein Q7I97_09615 [Thermovirgaceae bacterium]|nr:hypothetical protein [Thermovirgaceae bacterium]
MLFALCDCNNFPASFDACAGPSAKEYSCRLKYHHPGLAGRVLKSSTLQCKMLEA